MEKLVDVSDLRHPGYWGGIWKLKVPPNIKNFIWHMCQGFLSTRVWLQDTSRFIMSRPLHEL